MTQYRFFLYLSAIALLCLTISGFVRPCNAQFELLVEHERNTGNVLLREVNGITIYTYVGASQISLIDASGTVRSYQIIDPSVRVIGFSESFEGFFLEMDDLSVQVLNVGQSVDQYSIDPFPISLWSAHDQIISTSLGTFIRSGGDISIYNLASESFDVEYSLPPSGVVRSGSDFLDADSLLVYVQSTYGPDSCCAHVAFRTGEGDWSIVDGVEKSLAHELGKGILYLGHDTGFQVFDLTKRDRGGSYIAYDRPAEPSAIREGPSGSVYFSTLVGEIWKYDEAVGWSTPVTTDESILSLVLEGSDVRAYASNTGLWYNTSIPVNTVHEPRDRSQGVDVYPNPANSGSPIFVQLPPNGTHHVSNTVNVFDVLGREVWTTRYMGDSIQIGTNVTSRLSPGVYLIILSTGDFYHRQTSTILVIE
ncbi:MAG: T9SS type A sorting domain-containing protein [Rhodothermales bacterium]